MKDSFYNSIPQDRFSTRSHKNEPDPQVLSLGAATPYNDEPASWHKAAISTMLQYKKEVTTHGSPKRGSLKQSL